MKKTLFPLCILSALLHGQTFPPVQTPAQLAAELNFLTSSTDQVGFTYAGSQGALNALTLPLSYYSTADYWGSYVGSLPWNNLAVVDVYNPVDYTLTPTSTSASPGNELQVERVDAWCGTNIYDAACWQIALAAFGKAGLGEGLFKMAQNQNILLQVGYDGNASQAQLNANRATTRQDGTFQYNGEKITSAPNAYFFRMVARNWLSQDPFLGTSYMNYVTALNLPPNTDYQAGKITWLDWNGYTGENAWAFFIGPLQTALLQQRAGGQTYVPFSSLAVQNALGVVYAFRCMQSELGAIYYACEGSFGVQGKHLVDRSEVSIQDNASVLAGLKIFQQVLEDELQYETDLSASQIQQIQTTLQEIQTIIYGGATPQGGSTQGILSFFKNYAWNPSFKTFYPGGLANNPKLQTDWKPLLVPQLVDAITWSATVLGQPLVDSWFGFGAAYNIWQSMKVWGGFYSPDGSLWGVGFTDQDGNGWGKFNSMGIVSSEGTAGALNMLRCLITQYSQVPGGAQYVGNLQKDHDSMYQYLMTLRSDLYPETGAYSLVCPKNYETLIPIPESKLAFLYASRRYKIPFSSVVNPIPSTTSTSWAVMLHFNLNPFNSTGDYSALSF